MDKDKTRLRETISARRTGLDPETARISSGVISRRILALPEIANAHTLLAFWPIEGRAEVDIRPALNALSERGVVIGLPVIRPNDPSRRLEFGILADEGELVPGPFGTLQPAGEHLIAPQEADAVVVPALAATRAGHRLGYGGGYYDRFLATTKAFSVIPLFAICLVDSLPLEPHDRPVAAIVTEDEEIRAGRNA